MSRTNTASGQSTFHATGTTTITTSEAVEHESPAQGPSNSAVLRLKKDKKKVKWNNDTVDNEHLGRKKSKCCCVYKKPHNFGESSSDSEEEDCDHCRGHVEKRANLNNSK